MKKARPFSSLVILMRVKHVARYILLIGIVKMPLKFNSAQFDVKFKDINF